MIGKLKKKIAKNKFTTLSLFVLLLFGLFLRTHFGTDYYTFGDEAIRDASVAFIGAKEFQFPLTGPFSSLGPFTFGPWYYYQLILSYLLIPSFWAPWISLTIFSLLFIITSYKIGAMIQDKYLGFITALLATVSIAQLDASRVLSNPYPIGFLASTVVLLAIQIYRGTKSNWRSYLWGFLTGVTIAYHYQAFLLLTLLIFSFSDIKKYLRVIEWYGIGLFSAMLPTLFFEFNNHWVTVRNILRYIQYDQYTIYIPNRWLSYLGNFVPNFWASVIGAFLPLTILIIFLTAFVLIRDFIKKKLPKEVFYLVVSAAIIFTILRYYRGERSYGYLQFFHVYLFIFIAYMIRNLFTRYKNITAIILCVILLISALAWQNKHYAKDRKNHYAWSVASELNQKWPQEKYDWYICGNFNWEKATAVSLIYDYDGRLSKAGKKIAYASNDCPLPLEENLSKLKQEDIMSLKNKRYSLIQLSEDQLVDLSYASESGLLKNNWSKINPQVVGDSTARWWFREQP